MQGRYVTERGYGSFFKALLNGEYDDYPEAAFMFVGSIEEVVEKAKSLGE